MTTSQVARQLTANPRPDTSSTPRARLESIDSDLEVPDEDVCDSRRDRPGRLKTGAAGRGSDSPPIWSGASASPAACSSVIESTPLW